MDSASQASQPNSLKKRYRNRCPLQFLLVKLKSTSGMGKIPSDFQAKNDVCLDFLAWVSQEQPAAARSSQQRSSSCQGIAPGRWPVAARSWPLAGCGLPMAACRWLMAAGRWRRAALLDGDRGSRDLSMCLNYFPGLVTSRA